MKKITLLFVIAFLSMSLQAQSIDSEKSIVNFEISALRVTTVDGTFKGMRGEAIFDENDLANAKFDVTIDVKTINTGINKRDEHLRTADFFEVETYPTIRISGSDISRTSSGYLAKVTLTIKNVSKEIELPFTVSQSEGAKLLTGKLDLLRKAYKVGEDTSNFTVGNKVKVEILCYLN